MRKMKSTKHALLMSTLSLLTCISMFVGSTFAWFTDSATSACNRIQSGTLDIDLVDKDGCTLEGELIEWVTQDNRVQDAILWEPGCTYETEEFWIVNKGTLDFKFKFDITGINGDAQLLDVIEFACTQDGNDFAFNTGAEYELKANGKMGPFVLSGQMEEDVSNVYQNLTIEGIAITLVATQLVSENDSFGPNYDENADWP